MRFFKWLSFGSLSLLSFIVTSSKVTAAPDKTYERDFYSKNGVVSSAKPEASQVGIDILKNGGNAVDAAVATAFAIGVLEPHASGLGGGGFMLIRMAKTGETIVIDYRETAPGKATENMFTLDANGRVVNGETSVGGKASGVPGNVAGLLSALEKYGTLKRSAILAPSIKYAKEGFPVTENFANTLSDNYVKLSSFPATEKIFLKDGLLYEVGDNFKQEDLAKTLEKISKNGKDAFYKGDIAKKIAAGVQEAGGIITEEDLAKYAIKERTPVTGTYRDYTIISTPPASSGGTHVIQLLNIMENFNVKDAGDNTAKAWHLWSEGLRQVFADRAKYMGDPDFVEVPTNGLLSKEYAKELSTKFNLNAPREDVTFGDPEKYESGNTTHFSVMDKDGNMVAVTQTINHFLGSGVVIPETGILMNNEMYDFDPNPGRKNSIKGGKRPLSSMTPTLVLDPQSRPFMTIGSPGANRIIPAVALTISNIIDHKMDIQEAINAPRIAQFQSGPLYLEGRVSINAYNDLIKMGHKTTLKGDYDNYFGGVQGVLMNYDTMTLEGGADPRRDGMATGF